MRPYHCSIQSCFSKGKLSSNGKRYFPKGYCNMHYIRFIKSGEVGEMDTRRSGLSNHPLFSTWWGMLQRCQYPKSVSYDNYGGRGITVCERWQTFANFLADMGNRPKGTTLDRIDNSKGYSPENCKWSSYSEQALNRRPKRQLNIGVTTV